jgi:hypothetical protein
MGPLGIVRLYNLLYKKFIVLRTSYIHNSLFLIIVGVIFFLTFFGIFNIVSIYTLDIRFYFIIIFSILFLF